MKHSEYTVESVTIKYKSAVRQTGRTSRIIDFTVNQLFETGAVIITDHISFEFETTFKQLDHFVQQVYRRVDLHLRGRKNKRLKHKYTKIDSIPVIIFTLEDTTHIY